MHSNGKMRHVEGNTLTPDSKTLTQHRALSTAFQKLLPAANLRLTIVNSGFATCHFLRRVPNSHLQIQGGPPQKMLKMKVDPEMYMKTKDRLTQ